MKLIAALAAAGAVLVLPAANATPTLQTFGINAVTEVSNCAWNAAHTQCDWIASGVNITTPIRSATSASSSASDARGSAWVSGEISATSYLPSLHAYASSNPDAAGVPGAPYGSTAAAYGGIWGVQSYVYTGDAPFLLTLTATLDSIFSRPDQDQQHNYASFRVSLFDSAGYAFGYSNNVVSDEVCPLWMAAPYNGYCTGMPTVFDFDEPFLSGSGTISTTLSHMLAPGQKFYVGAYLEAAVCCGVTVDASHSLNMVFNDASQLENFAVPGALVVVPEPASLPIALLGLGLLAGLRRGARVRPCH